MPSTTLTLHRTMALALAAAAMVFSIAACSAPIPHGTDTPAAKSSNVDPAPSPHRSQDTDGPNAALCADALGEGFSIDTNASDIAKVLATWDQMSTDSTGHIHDDIVTVDKALHKASEGDASAIDDAFRKSVTEVGTWVAENCNVQG